MSVTARLTVSSFGTDGPDSTRPWGALFLPPKAMGQEILGLDQEEANDGVAEVRTWWTSIIHGTIALLRHVSRVECSHAPRLVGLSSNSPSRELFREYSKLEKIAFFLSQNACSCFIASALWFNV